MKRVEKMKKLSEENPIKFLGYFLAIVALIVIIACVFFLMTHVADNFFVFPRKLTRGRELDSANTDEVNAILFLLTGMATVALAVVVYLQLKKLHDTNKLQEKTAKGDFLLRIDERWTSQEILEARTIIHGIEVNLCFSSKEKEEEIGNEIVRLSKTSKEKKDFMSLVNFLDFLETIGFLFVNNYIEAISLDELCGDSIKIYYKVFLPYIKSREGICDYSGFRRLYEELNKKAQ